MNGGLIFFVMPEYTFFLCDGVEAMCYMLIYNRFKVDDLQ